MFADARRNLGSFDPILREMHIGLGCAIENIALAANPNGFRVEAELVPGNLAALGERTGIVLAARMHLTPVPRDTPADPLFAAIPKRHTNRHPYDRARGLPAETEARLIHAANDAELRLFFFRDGEMRGAFDAAVAGATESIVL